jgi:hypothetical protein
MSVLNDLLKLTDDQRDHLLRNIIYEKEISTETRKFLTLILLSYDKQVQEIMALPTLEEIEQFKADIDRVAKHFNMEAVIIGLDKLEKNEYKDNDEKKNI